MVLLTGGARGITAEIALELAERHRPTLVLVGRTPPPTGAEHASTAGFADPASLRTAFVAAAQEEGRPLRPAEVESRVRQVLAERELRTNLGRLRATGAEVEYVAADVRDEAGLVAVLDGVVTRHGRLDGVVHGAGVLADGLAREKQTADFDRVFGTKVDPAFVLARHLDPEKLSFLFFFASVAGRFGNAGQTDYAAANEVLVALARDLDRRWPARVSALCWGPWAAGMVTADLQDRFRARGVEPIEVGAGRRLFAEELVATDRAPVVVLGRGPWSRPAPRCSIPALPVRLRRSATPGQAAVLSVDLHPDEAYLRDHRIDGRSVLPLAVAAELLAEAAELANPGLGVVELRDLALLDGVVVDKPVSMVLHVEPDPRDGTELGCTLTVAGAARPSYRARARLAERLVPLAAGLPGAAPVPAPPAPTDPYATHLFHGPAWQGIEHVTVDGSHWDVELHTSPPGRMTDRSPGGAWVLDPTLLDLAPQLAILWSQAELGTTPLPYGVAAVRHGAGSDPRRARFRVRPDADPSYLVADFEVVDRQGRLLLGVEGLQAAGSPALNRLAGAGATR